MITTIEILGLVLLVACAVALVRLHLLINRLRRAIDKDLKEEL